MSTTSYPYSFFTYFQSGFSQDVLTLDIYAVAELKALFVSITTVDADVVITFSSELTPLQKSTLDDIVAGHNPANRPIDNFSVFVHAENPGVAGGPFTPGTWTTRPLTMTSQGRNVSLWVSASSNQIKLAPGIYVMGANSVVGPDIGVNQLRFHNTSNGITEIVGTTTGARSAVLQGSFTVTDANHAYELQHRCAVPANPIVPAPATGLGEPGNFGPEIYTTLRITQSE